MCKREYGFTLGPERLLLTLIMTSLILGTGMFGLSGCSQGVASPSIQLAALPYGQNALEPFISQKTLEFHYGKHYPAYVEKTIELVRGNPARPAPS